MPEGFRALGGPLRLYECCKCAALVRVHGLDRHTTWHSMQAAGHAEVAKQVRRADSRTRLLG